MKNKSFIPKHLYSTFKRHPFFWGTCFVLFISWYFVLPKNLFETPFSNVLLSREGILLGARIAEDGQWRFPEQDSLPMRFEQCILHFEDEYFYYHPGFNPISITKALWQNFTTESRRGASTLTQQVIRLSRKNKRRTYWEKIIEMAMATRLEIRFSKKEILSLYASQAPFGGNVVGLETASWRYFGLPAHDLSWGQAAALAVLPNSPALVFPGKNEAVFRNKRDALLRKLNTNHIIDQTTYELSLSEPLPGKPLPLPDIAPHLTERTRKEHPGKQLLSTVQYSLQQQLNQIAEEFHFQLKQNQIHNLAILVLDIESREVLGYIGNAPTTGEHNRFVDIIQSPRSTGSILKPFLYTAVLDEGTILPNTLLADVPTSINGYSPQNFDKGFSGAVPAGLALARSLNIPAVRILQEYGLAKFYNQLKKLGQKHINKPADHYGLSLILGGAESSLWDITKAYAGMASTLTHYNATLGEYRSNEFAEPVYLKASVGSSDTPIVLSSEEEKRFGTYQFVPTIFDAGAIYHSLKALEEVNRPRGEENWSFFSHSQPVSWKTGTSYGFKDAWAVGVTSKYAIGVWAGNADGEGRPGLTGLQIAAPILFRVLDKLPKANSFQIPYGELIEAEVCRQSGHLAGMYCQESDKEWLPKNGTKTAACTYHRQVFLDKNQLYQVNASCYPLAEMKVQSRFVLPPIMEYYYASKHPEYSGLPPFKSGCFQDNEMPMEFIYPKVNEAIILPKDFDESTNPVVFKLAHKNPETKVYWYLGKTFMGTTESFHEISLLPETGSYLLTVVDGKGNSLSRKVKIERDL